MSLQEGCRVPQFFTRLHVFLVRGGGVDKLGTTSEFESTFLYSNNFIFLSPRNWSLVILFEHNRGAFDQHHLAEESAFMYKFNQTDPLGRSTWSHITTECSTLRQCTTIVNICKIGYNWRHQQRAISRRVLFHFKSDHFRLCA